MRQPQAANASSPSQVRVPITTSKRGEQAQRRGGLDAAGVEPAPVVGRMLGDIGRGAAIFAAERQALQQPQQTSSDRRGHADRGIAGQQADHEGRQPHHPHGDEEGVLAPDQIADPAEHQRPERPHRESLRQRRRARR